MTVPKNPRFRKFTLKSLLAISGSLIIFTSWVVQQHQADTTATKEALKRSQLVVDIEEVQRSITEINYTEQAIKKPIDPLRLALAQTNLADCYMRLLSRSKERVDSTDTAYINLVALKNKFDQENRSAIVTHQFTHIDSNFKKTVAMFQKDFKDLDNKFTSRYQGAVEDDERSSFWYFLSYGMGSLLVGISYMLKGE